MGKSTKLIAGTVAGVLCVTLYATFSSMSIDSRDIISSYTTSLANKTTSRVASSFNAGQAGNLNRATSTGDNLSVHGNTPEIKRYLEIARQVHVEWRSNGIPYVQANMSYKGEMIRPDCSGYTHEVLKRAGIYTGPGPGDSDNNLEPYGFKKIYLTAPDQVEDGDIIVWDAIGCYYKKGASHSRHMQIVVDANNGRCYNWGSNEGLDRLYAGVSSSDILNFDPLTSGPLFRPEGDIYNRTWKESLDAHVRVWRYTGK